MRGTGVVVACPCRVAPNRVTALSTVRSCMVMLSRHTLIHRLALPAQLRNNCGRSLRGKKRPRTRLRIRHRVRHEGHLALTISTRRTHFDRTPHLARGTRTWPWPVYMTKTLVTIESDTFIDSCSLYPIRQSIGEASSTGMPHTRYAPAILRNISM